MYNIVNVYDKLVWCPNCDLALNIENEQQIVFYEERESYIIGKVNIDIQIKIPICNKCKAKLQNQYISNYIEQELWGEVTKKGLTSEGYNFDSTLSKILKAIQRKDLNHWELYRQERELACNLKLKKTIKNTSTTYLK